MFGMTLSFATAGIGQVYLERILGLGYLDTQLKIQVHFLMLVATASLFTVGVALFICDFFRHAPRFELTDDMRDDPAPVGSARGALMRAARASRGASPEPESTCTDRRIGTREPYYLPVGRRGRHLRAVPRARAGGDAERARPAAARRASSSTWPGGWGGRW